jgi:hypothetical protein
MESMKSMLERLIGSPPVRSGKWGTVDDRRDLEIAVEMDSEHAGISPQRSLSTIAVRGRPSSGPCVFDTGGRFDTQQILSLIEERLHGVQRATYSLGKGWKLFARRTDVTGVVVSPAKHAWGIPFSR